MSDSNIDITTHSCLTYLHHCPVCSNWRSMHHTQQSAMWALRPSSWIYTHSALVYTVIGPTPPEVFGVSRKLCSILATSQKHKINPRWLRYNMFIYSNSSMHPWHLWVLQQHLKVYRHMTCCRIPNIPFSLGFFVLFREHFPSGQVGAHKRKCVCQLYKSMGSLHSRITDECCFMVKFIHVWTFSAIQTDEACCKTLWICVMFHTLDGWFIENPSWVLN